MHPSCFPLPGTLVNNHETHKETRKMSLILGKIYFALRTLIEREEGQDLVEYALIVALIALAATVGMDSLANAINTAFSNLGTIVGTYT
jgi:pilus assembly protein Flp/PilA